MSDGGNFRSGIDESVFEKSTLFAGLDSGALSSLAGLFRKKELQTGDILFHRGDRSDGCYVVVDGALKISTETLHGEETLIAMLAMGDVVGEMGLIDGLPRSATVTALKPSSLAYLSTRDFTRFAENNPAVYRHMLRIVSTRLRLSNDHFSAHLLLPLGGRLARVMLLLSDCLGQPLDDGRILIRQKITQAELALMSGSSREHVNRVLNDWRKKKIVTRVGSHYCLDQEDVLRDLAEI